jgi:HD superfamily phosphohydrolase
MKDNFKDTLRKKYGDEGTEEEYAAAYNIILQIEKVLKERYRIDDPIGVGGGGIVIQIYDNNLKVPRALKLSRPKPGNEDSYSNALLKEIGRLSEVSHQNIISIYDANKVEYGGKSYFYYIMEYIADVVDGEEYIKKMTPNYHNLISFLIQWASGLLTLHNHGIIHGDTKLKNVLVSTKTLIAKVSDLGSAKLLRDDSGLTEITFTSKYAHPELVNLLHKIPTDPNRAYMDISRDQLKNSFDLYSFGKSIFEILDEKEYKDSIQITEYQRNYLTLLAGRLLDGENNTLETFLTISPKGMEQIKYDSIEEVLTDLKKANGEYSIDEIIPELNVYSKKTIQVSSSGINTFTDRVSRLLNTKLISRLANITQLGLMVYVYPTAVHTRFEHVLGTMLNVAKFIDALWHDPVNPFFKQVITEKDIKILLVGALLHDVGQYALAHDLEEADYSIFSHTNNNRKLLQSEEVKKILSPILKKEWDLSIEDIYPILGIDSNNETYKNRLLRSIIDGPIDADKLDYLIRDSNNLNIPYGKAIDYSKIIKSLTVVFEHNFAKIVPSLGIHEKGKIAAEGVAFARYALFGTVYWHHTLRSIKAMLHRAVWEFLPEYEDRRKRAYNDIQDEIFNEINDQIFIKKQPWLDFETDNKSELKFISNINPYDFKILSFIYKKTNAVGKELLEMICSRNLYKRLLVISHAKSPNEWEQMFNIRTKYSWKYWLFFQKTFDDLLFEDIMKIKDRQRTTTVLAQEYTDKFRLLKSRNMPVFLIDIPIPRTGSSSPLRYLHEFRFVNSMQYNPEETIQPEDSAFWKSITGDLTKSIGKARVFCHPDIIDTASAFYSRDMILNTIDIACRKTREMC